MRIRYAILATLIAAGCASSTKPLDDVLREREEQERVEHDVALDAQVGRERQQVMVRRASISVPSCLPWNDRFMWDNVGSDSMHTNFTSITTAQWALKWKVFSQCLVAKANTEKLDGAALAKSLSAIAPKVDQSAACVPYAACSIHDPQTGSNYWGISAVWEYESVQPRQMCHIRMWLVNSSNLTVIGEASCD